jgi:hypothetical protein
VNETGVRNRLDAPETFLGRPHPQGLKARYHPECHPGDACYYIDGRCPLPLADVMGSLPGGETGYPQEHEYQNAFDPILARIPSTASQPIVTNHEGGKQSVTLGRYDLIPGEALTRVAQVLEHGVSPVPGVRDGYPAGNWKKIPGYQHINHALEHLAMISMGRTDEDHLGHALTRLCFAVWAEANRGDMHEEALGAK